MLHMVIECYVIDLNNNNNPRGVTRSINAYRVNSSNELRPAWITGDPRATFSFFLFFPLFFCFFDACTSADIFSFF